MGEDMENVFVPPLHPGWFDISNEVTVILQEALAGNKDIREALQEGCDTIERILNDFATGKR